MGKRVLKKVFWVSIVIILCVISAENAFAEKKVLLQVQAVCPTRLKALGSTLNWVAENLKVASNGNMNMKIFEPGQLVPPHEILDAVSKGRISAGFTAAADWAGKIPAISLFCAVPFGPDPTVYASWFYYGNGMKLYQECYDRSGYNIKVLLVGMCSPETAGWFNKKIESKADLKGLRMRFLGLGGQVIQRVGGSVTLLPMAETFQALEKGAIDGAEICFPSVDHELGLYKIAKYNYFPGWHQPATAIELIINKDVWNKLTESQQRLLEVTCKAATLDMLSYSEAIQGQYVQGNEDNPKVENMVWSKELLGEFKGAWADIVKEECEKDEFFKKVWDDLSAFVKLNHKWQEYGYLPRDSKVK